MNVMLINGAWPLDRIGGSEIQTKILADELVAMGDQVHYVAVAAASGPIEAASAEGVTIHRIAKSMSLPQRAEELSRIVGAVAPDVCYVRILPWLRAVTDICHGVGVPVVLNIASDMDVEPPSPTAALAFGRFGDWRRLRVLRDAQSAILCVDLVVAQTDAQLQRLGSFGGARGCVIRNMFPVPRCAVDYRLPRRVLWVGSIKAVKRPDRFVSLARLLADSSIEFHMIGEVQDRRWGRLVTSAAEEMDNLTYHGMRAYDETWSEIQSSWLVVNTSEHEGFPNVLIQAWLSGVPTASLGLDPDGLIKKRGLGIVAETPELMAEEIRRLLADGRMRQEISARARTYAAENHSASENGRRYRNEFARLAAHGS
jgi:glycosyltransferase involved in cell wall biosynthesis